MSSEHLCLKWNNFENNIVSYLDLLRNENDFVDVTITCGEKNFKAHKVILSACSPYFKGIFQENPCSHPVIILKNVSSNEMEAIIQYIYTGETYITKDDLPSFLNTANLLQVIGLINYNSYSFNHGVQNGTGIAKANDYNGSSAPKTKTVTSQPKPNILVKKFNTRSDDAPPPPPPVPAHARAHSPAHAHARAHSPAHAHAPAHAPTHAPAHAPAHSHSHSHSHSHAHTHTHTHTHAHAPAPAPAPTSVLTPVLTPVITPVLTPVITPVITSVLSAAPPSIAPPPPKKPESPAPKKRTQSVNSDIEGQFEIPSPKTEENCPILSKQLLLPKKRKLSVVDQNKNVEFYDNSELSNSSEEVKESTTILRGCLAERGENEHEPEEIPPFPNLVTIKKEAVETENVLEPLVGLSIKGENDFEPANEENLHNGDILLQRLQSFQEEKEVRTEPQEVVLKIPKPDISIFSKKFSKPELEGENLTLTPNVEIFLRNANNSSENLIQKLARINLFKAKQLKKIKKPVSTPKPEVVVPGPSKNDKDPIAMKNGIGGENKTFHLTSLPCPHCRQVYNNLSALKYHVRLMHSDLENKLFCYLCPMNFIEREYFKIHLWEAHNARF